jgi:hypothetical protein
VFLPEFIPGSSRGWVPLSPEFSDEEVSLSIILKLKEGRFFLGSDDIEYVLLEPNLVFLSEFRTIFSSGKDRKSQCLTDKNRENNPSHSHGNTQI